MRKLVLLNLGLLGLFLTGCVRDDDDNSYYPRLEIYDAFTFENEENYQVGDTLFFNLSFSRYLDEEGYDTKLDIFESTNSKDFFYTTHFQKFSSFSDLYQGVYVGDDLYYSPNGTVNVAQLNTSTNTYESQMGIILAEEGEYSISFDLVYINSGTSFYSEDINLNIINFSENTPETYYFTVGE